MQATAVNILDQLLGVVDPAQTPTFGTSPHVGDAANSLPFGNLLSLLVNGQGVIVEPPAEATDLAQPAQVNQPTIPFEQLLTGATMPETNTETVAPVIVDDLTALVSNDKAGWIEEQPLVARELPRVTVADRPVTVMANSFVANQNVRDLINSQPVELESAIYKVLDAGIKGDNLELKVVADNNNAEPVKITLPAEMLTSKDAGDAMAAIRGDKNKSTAITGVQRVALNDFAAPVTENLDDVLAKLNLKAVEVKLEPTANTAQTEKQQVTLQMFGVVNGNQVVIKSKLDKQQIETRTDHKTAHPTLIKQASTGLEADDKSVAQPIKTEARETQRPVAAPVQDVRRQMPFNLVEKLTGNETYAPFETTSLQSDNVASKGELMPRFDTTANPTPVAKLSLPPSFDKALRPGGQSVMLKIEPEQLGPARLHLQMQNNMLTARVTVESAMAKTAVEFSLDQLTDQLSRAGIEVDRIEVTLSDRESREQFFHRRPNWAQPQNQGAGRSDESFELEQVTPSPTLYTPPTEFVRADGVNLLV